MPNAANAKVESGNDSGAYPTGLWEKEKEFFEARREASGIPHGDSTDGIPDDAVGFALSGGGIRSATFCFGVFQALVKNDLFKHIDFLSTVSGGGYFGGMLGRLFARPGLTSHTDLKDDLGPRGRIEGWLRENGRYLSPKGSGDLLLSGAVMLRNWLAIQFVMISFLLLGFILLRLVAYGPDWDRLASLRTHLPQLLGIATPLKSLVWWSSLWIMPELVLVLWLVPVGWTYWWIGAWKGMSFWEKPVGGVLWTVIVGAVALACVIASASSNWMWPLLAITEVTLSFAAWRLVISVSKKRFKHLGKSKSDDGVQGFMIEEQRNRISHWFNSGLIAVAVTAAVALVDTVGQSLYLGATKSHPSVSIWIKAIWSLLLGLAPFGKRLATTVGGKAGGKRLPVSQSVMVGTAAITTAAIMLVSVDFLSHGIRWAFKAPSNAPALTWIQPSRTAVIDATVQRTAAGPSAIVDTHLLTDSQARETAASASPRDTPCPWFRAAVAILVLWCNNASASQIGRLSVVAVVLLGLCLLIGRIWLFLNNSSLHATYKARLVRAYLGASRYLSGATDELRESVTRVQFDDNIQPTSYWAPPGQSRSTLRPPIHFINVTINETIDGRSQIEQRDRKGLNLALGPCSFSVGVHDHAVFENHQSLQSKKEMTVCSCDCERLPVFDSKWNGGEPLSVGDWVAISGASFSTGMGSRTSLGLSFLCGFGNVRLGYWWDSGSDRRGMIPWHARLNPFHVQTYLFNEFLSRFHGTARKRWYLSDGGHFENLGGYELIRRRLKRMVVVDAEQDPEYQFEGLANLVRKARIDFGAEITFQTADELDRMVAQPYRHLFGALEELRRGKWVQEPVNDPNRPNTEVRHNRVAIDEPVDISRYSLAHAALATITYSDGTIGKLVYIKPTLTGDEPADITQYHRMHPDFPQETTNDQFFDEAQWESYRKLGSLITDQIFAEVESIPKGKFTARSLIFSHLP